MTRISKQAERRNRSPRKHRPPAPKTGPKKDALPKGFKEHANPLAAAGVNHGFIPNIK